MTKKDLVSKEIQDFPDKLLEEVLDFIEYLKIKLSKNKMETAILSETLLKKDWLLPEEDEAWKNL